MLRDDVSQMPKNWNRRFKHNRDKIKTGDVYELAEVVRNLAIRETDKGLSTGEKQMYTRAKKILASELMYALEMEEGEAEEHLDKLIEEAHDERNGAGRGGEVAQHPMTVVGIIPAGRQRRAPWRPMAPRRSSFVAAVRCSTGRSTCCEAVCDRVVVAVPSGCEATARIECAGGALALRVGAAALAAAPEADVAVVHDAARPLVSRELVRALHSRPSSGGYDARDRRRADDATRSRRPIADRHVVRTLDRSTLWSIQTPQVFRADASAPGARCQPDRPRWRRRPMTRCWSRRRGDRCAWWRRPPTT